MNKILTILLLFLMILGIEVLYVPNLVSGSNIIQAEYFIDEDPGEGNGIALSALDGAFDSPKEQVELTLDTSGLKIGVHNLFIRMQTEELLWGTPRKILFEVTGDKYISAAEYFVDNPCEGMGTSMPPEDGIFDQLKENVLADVDTSDLSLGIHTIYVRMKDSEYHWGTCTAYKVEVRVPPYITGAEYFIDDDPGPGHGAQMGCKDGDCDDSTEIIEATFRAWCLSLGNHTLYVRAKDSYSRWSRWWELGNVPIYIEEPPADICEGDANGDGVVNVLDKVLVRNHFGESSEIGWWFDADVNCDGVVNVLDKVIVRNQFGCSSN
jgi:hypothetical protein